MVRNCGFSETFFFVVCDDIWIAIYPSFVVVTISLNPTAHMLLKTLSKPQVAWTNVILDTILSTTIFQVVMAGKYVCRHRVEWRFL